MEEVFFNWYEIIGFVYVYFLMSLVDLEVVKVCKKVFFSVYIEKEDSGISRIF